MLYLQHIVVEISCYTHVIMASQREKIEARIASIKAELTAIEEMRPGSLTRQYKYPEQRSGAYYQLSYTRDGRSRTEYVPRDFVREVKIQIANYKKVKALIDEWVALGIEQSRLRIKGEAD
jgi:hypothetical protein